MTPHFSLAGLFRPAHTADDSDDPGQGPSHAQIASRLAEWRHRGHRSIRILDLACGRGDRLLRAAARARELGFVSIEARGVDPSPGHVRHARHRAESEAHPSTSIVFEIGEPIAALAAEHDGAADLVLLSEPRPYPCSPLGTALDRVCAGFVLSAP
ncbi:class I SAM-dependent methyltransferase [Sphingomonas sp. dw_22]|uniref:class I SAM-dependent methyltransferase n=1 Tax=Sphingomonas sp. dw_22 TaxID=2721175 RepID=UPI001BD3DB54